ncbi:MAG: hypothetical protein C0434_08100 [Xanthomonadaceae bacterium]|nr:hypothetical protein [Xanthomonadaceae bacterium]
MSVGTGAGKVKETELQKTRTDIGAKYFDDYRKRWRPARDRLISRVMNDDTSNRQRAQGMATGAVDAAFAKQPKAISEALAKRGAGIGSAKSNLAVAQNFADQAQSRGMAEVDATQASDDIEYGKKMGLTAIGRGEVASANAGTAALASLSGAQAEADAQRALQKSIGTGELIGTGLGAGASVFLAGGEKKAPGLTMNGGAPAADEAFQNVSGYSKWR